MAAYSLGGLAAFAAVVLVTELALVGEAWVRALYLPHLALGALVGANLGIAAAARRGTDAVVERSTGLLGVLVDRAVGELAIPERGIEVERLRAMAELGGIGPAGGGAVTRGLARFAVVRALEQAGYRAIRDQFLRAVLEAEARGDALVSQASVREAARNGLSVAFAQQLERGWSANRGVSLLVSAALLASLPALALLVG